MQRAISKDGAIITGDDLCKEISEHYTTTHSTAPDNEQTSFPKLDVDLRTIIRMMRNVGRNKGIAYDGVTDKLFSIGRDDCRGKEEYC